MSQGLAKFSERLDWLLSHGDTDINRRQYGWRDEVVPYEHSVRFAQSYHSALHLLESDHRLHNQIRVIQYLFEYFLIALDLPPIAFE